ncbi:MAG: alpha/beta fold hydrolase [Rubritepida sp.]|nr:alpha/beta fold hydrolase [Rubritepida sp.]
MILNLVESGTGPPLVLLHGLMGAAQNWGGIARRLARTHRVLAIDARNHGASPHATGMGYATLAQDVAETLAALGVERAAVLGHSMGGKIAMMLALTRPDLVDRLVVADIAPVRYAAPSRAYVLAMQAMALPHGLTRREAMAALEPAEPAEGIRAFLLQNLVFGDTPHWRIGLHEIAAGMAEIEDFAPPPGVRYDGPALFIRGSRSNYIQSEYMPAILGFFPAAGHAVVEAAHWVHSENPNAFLATLEPFLES